MVLIFKGFVVTDIDNRSVEQISDSGDNILNDDDDDHVNLEMNECVSSGKENQVDSGIYFQAKKIPHTFTYS